MKRIIFSIIVIVVFCVFGYVFAQETPQSEAEEPTPQKAGEPVDVIKVIDVEPFYYCALEMTGSYDQHETGFTTLYDQAGHQDLPMDEVPLGIYKSDPN